MVVRKHAGCSQVLWLRLKLGTVWTWLASVYLPPNLTANQVNDFYDLLTEQVQDSRSKNVECIILGDLNAHHPSLLKDIGVHDAKANNSGKGLLNLTSRTGINILNVTAKNLGTWTRGTDGPDKTKSVLDLALHSGSKLKFSLDVDEDHNQVIAKCSA